MKQIKGLGGLIILFLLTIASISSATLTLTDTSITESGDYLTLSAGETVNITSGAIFTGSVLEGCSGTIPMVRVGHHGVWDCPAVFFDDTFTSWGIDLLSETDTFRIFKPANVIFTLTDSLATIDVDLDVTGELDVGENITVSENITTGYGFLSPSDIWLRNFGIPGVMITASGDVYTYGTLFNDGNIRQTGEYWLFNTMGLTYPEVHMSSSGIEIYDGTVAENIMVNLTNTGDIVATGNITADNAWIPAYLFAHTHNNITLSGAGTWMNVTFNRTESLKQRITHTYNDATNDTFTIVDTGIYDMHAHLSFEDSAATPNSNICFRFMKNGVEIPGSLREKDLDKKDWDSLVSTTVFASLTAGDEIKLQFTSDDTTVRLDSDFTYGDHQDTAVIKIKRIS